MSRSELLTNALPQEAGKIVPFLLMQSAERSDGGGHPGYRVGERRTALIDEDAAVGRRDLTSIDEGLVSPAPMILSPLSVVIDETRGTSRPRGSRSSLLVASP